MGVKKDYEGGGGDGGGRMGVVDGLEEESAIKGNDSWRESANE